MGHFEKKIENWIIQHLDELWWWITNCDEDYKKCPLCPHKEACDAIWIIVKKGESHD